MTDTLHQRTTGLARPAISALLVVCVAGGCSSETAPRPSLALLGQWRGVDYQGKHHVDWFFKAGPSDHITRTAVSTEDGEKSTAEFVVVAELGSPGTVKLKRWWRKELGETRQESHLNETADRVDFSIGMKKFAYFNEHADGTETGPFLFEFSGDRQEP